jgi:hypothetical protein
MSSYAYVAVDPAGRKHGERWRCRINLKRCGGSKRWDCFRQESLKRASLAHRHGRKLQNRWQLNVLSWVSPSGQREDPDDIYPAARNFD